MSWPQPSESSWARTDPASADRFLESYMVATLPCSMTTTIRQVSAAMAFILARTGVAAARTFRLAPRPRLSGCRCPGGPIRAMFVLVIAVVSVCGEYRRSGLHGVGVKA